MSGARAEPSAARGNDRNSGYARVGADWYAEGPEAVLPLIDVETFDNPVHDPACGGGNIVRTFRNAGIRASGSDLIDRRGGAFDVVDFFRDQRSRPIIVTNPPFGCSARFVLHALDVTSDLVCVLQQVSWLEGIARHNELWSRGLLARVWMFSDRISIPPGGQGIERKGGAMRYAWFVFEPQRTPSPLWQGGWIRADARPAGVCQAALNLD